MPTCIIVEDGTIVTDANSYITAAQAETLLNSIGETFGDIPTATIETNLLKATRYLESFRNRYKGDKVSGTQSLQFPRSGLVIDKFSIASDTIPNEVKLAQATAALVEVNGEVLQSSNNGQTILQESIAGAISVTYANDGISGNVMSYPITDTYLKPLLKSNTFNQQVYRP